MHFQSAFFYFQKYKNIDYFINKFSVKEKTQFLLVTSAIYAPYQLLKFIPLALEYDLEVDVVGTPPTSGIPQTASHYLQEIKSIGAPVLFSVVSISEIIPISVIVPKDDLSRPLING